MVIKLELWEIFSHINVGLILSKIPLSLDYYCYRNKIHPETQNASPTVFRKHLLKKIYSVPHSIYNICYPNGLKLRTKLRLGLSYLNEHRFNHNF